MKQLIVAVSGGVDSAVLLDLLYHKTEKELVVAHVDHGIREDSRETAEFVEGLARSYELPYVSTRFELGQEASEELAREKRYEFLYQEAQARGAAIVAAHTRDDAVGSVAINFARGTGWRGLAVMNRAGIVRPLLGWTKRDVYDYALKNRLEWVEDSTNSSSKYLRNRMRGQVLALGDNKAERLLELRTKQIDLKTDIAQEKDSLLGEMAGLRYAYIMIPEAAALELLRAECKRAMGVSPARAQLLRAVLAIKTAGPGTSHDIGDGCRLGFTSRNFVVYPSPKMVQ